MSLDPLNICSGFKNIAWWSNLLVTTVSTPWLPKTNTHWLATTLSRRSLVKVSLLCLFDQVNFCYVQNKSISPLISRNDLKASIWGMSRGLPPIFSSQVVILLKSPITHQLLSISGLILPSKFHNIALLLVLGAL